jgi:ech hydrogenase subunit E
MEPPVTGYCQRGIAELVAGKPTAEALAIVERSCSLAGTAHRTVVCQAIETLTGAKPSRQAERTRALFAETERILARLWTLALTARAAGLTRPFRDALDQRETLFSALESATGERHYWAIAVPGGVRDDLDMDPLQTAIEKIQAVVPMWRALTEPKGALGRAGKGVGVVSAEAAESSGLSGLAALGSLAQPDLRQQKPYGGYAGLTIEWPEAAETLTGDVAARMVQAVEDIATSASIAESCFTALSGTRDGRAQSGKAGTTGAGNGRSAVEGPHGTVAATVALAGANQIASLHLETPAAAVLDALPAAFEGASIEQVPLILMSLDFCAECLDQ